MKGNRIRFDLEKLNNQITIESYINILQTELNNIDILNKGTTMIYKMVETSIISATSETIGKHRPKEQAWITNELLDLCDERRTLKSTLKADLSRRNEYNTLNAMLRRMMNKTKE